MAVEDTLGAEQLLGQQDAYKQVRPGHLAERQGEIGPLQDRG